MDWETESGSRGKVGMQGRQKAEAKGRRQTQEMEISEGGRETQKMKATMGKEP